MDALAGAPPGEPPAADDAPAVGVPGIVAVVVTHDAGPWLEETLAALGAQDYPNLSVLVIDAASQDDPTPRIAHALPSAYVRRLEANDGFAAAANDVLGVVEGASHYVFLHDDAAPDPDALRLLVEESFRSNAGVVAPKLVDWDDRRRLLAVGATADKSGVVTPYGRHELDQEQHDAVRDVFVAPGGCTLVRADLFEALAGFDAGIPLFGEDLDLCWRVQVLGARVVVAPAARVRHREATVTGLRPLEIGSSAPGGLVDQIGRLQLRHRLRTLLKCYGPLHLLFVLPQLLLLMAGDAALAVVWGRRRLAGAVLDAWRWNLGHRAETAGARKGLQAHRALRDREVRRLQSRGGSRLAAALRGGLAVEERAFGIGIAGRRVAGAVTAGGARQNLVVWLAVTAVLLVGSRRLLSGPLPAIGQFAPFPDSPLTFLRHFVSGWRTSGMGGEAPAPFAFALLGVGGLLLGGAMGLLQKIVVLGAIPVGILGAHRLAAPVGSWRARVAAGVLYAAVPLPYDALAGGRWSGLLSYATAPWLLARLLRATGLAPFGRAPAEAGAAGAPPPPPRPEPADAVEQLLGAEAASVDPVATEEFRLAAVALGGRPEAQRDDDGGRPTVPAVPSGVLRPGPLLHQAVVAALILAVAAAFVPALVAVSVVVGLAIVLGGVVVGDLRPTLRALAVAGGSALGAGLLLVPWTLELVLPGARWAGFAGLGAPASSAPGLGELLRFATGPTGASPLGWALLAAAVLPLLVGRRWRFSWAARLWIVAAVLWSVAWLAGRGWLGVPPPALEVLLAPAAAALVLAAVLGFAAFETDLPGYRFGLNQLAVLVAAAAAVAATLPVVAASLDGRWNMPGRDYAGLLSWMPERRADGAFRVLWAGEPQVLPLDGWALAGGLAYGSSRGGTPEATDLWPASDQGATGLLADALGVARRGETSRLGHLLGPLGVRYLAVPHVLAPAGQGGSPVPASPATEDLLAALRAQIDLKLIETDGSLVVYENAAWAPARSVLPPDALPASRRGGLEAARTTELAGGRPVLREVTPTRFVGTWPGGNLLFSEAYSPRWRFRVDGASGAPHRRAFGWANAFSAEGAGTSTLEYRTSPLRYAALLLQLGLWVAALRLVVGGIRAGSPRDPLAAVPPPR